MVVGNDKRCCHGPELGQAGLAAIVSGGLVIQDSRRAPWSLESAEARDLQSAYARKGRARSGCRAPSPSVEASLYGWLLGGFK